MNTPRVTNKLFYALTATLSGALWFLIPLSFDSGWGLPHGWLGRIAALCCGVVTGLVIAFTFARAFSYSSRVTFFLLPFITLPTAIVLFSVLVWVARIGLGEHFYPAPPRGDLSLILEAYIVYGLLSFGTPVLYGLALLNQWVMQLVQQRSI